MEAGKGAIGGVAGRSVPVEHFLLRESRYVRGVCGEPGCGARRTSATDGAVGLVARQGASCRALFTDALGDCSSASVFLFPGRDARVRLTGLEPPASLLN